jgi:hypothetical protein
MLTKKQASRDNQKCGFRRSVSIDHQTGDFCGGRLSVEGGDPADGGGGAGDGAGVSATELDSGCFEATISSPNP